MINTQFKIQPVAAFYRLLAKSFIFILIVSLVLSTISFIVLKISLTHSLGPDGIKEMAQLIEEPSTDMMEQSKAMQTFVLKHPSLVSLISGALILSLFFISYLFFTTQHFLKNMSLGIKNKLSLLLIPNHGYFRVLLFLLLISGFLTFASGFIALSIAANPIMGIIAGLFIGSLFVRNCLLIPGLIIGEMNFSDSIKYSFQTITLGRAFKIVIFGSLIFLVLSFILSALVYFPSLLVKTASAKMYFNILVFYLQIGCVSVGLTALFLRYGNFEEEKIAE